MEKETNLPGKEIAEKKTSKLDRLNAISDPLEAARQMHQDWLTYGTDFIHLYVEDVEGDWLENWDEDDLAEENF